MTSDDSIPEQEDIVDLVHRLIKIFVARLRIVQQAIQETHPRLIVQRMNITDPQERAKFIKDYWQNTRGIGVWNREWKYRVHGIGCELINIHTGEPLHWDIGHRNCFDKNWFVDYVVWQFNEDNCEMYLSPLLSQLDEISRFSVREVVFPILEILSEKKILSEELNNHRYVLLE